jgi:hypothetical protein
VKAEQRAIRFVNLKMERRTDPIGHDSRSCNRYAFLKISNALQRGAIGTSLFCVVVGGRFLCLLGSQEEVTARIKAKYRGLSTALRFGRDDVLLELVQNYKKIDLPNPNGLPNPDSRHLDWSCAALSRDVVERPLYLSLPAQLLGF